MDKKLDEDVQGLTSERWDKQTILSRKEENTSSLKIVWMQEYEDKRTTLKKRKEILIITASDRIENIRTNRITAKSSKQKWEEKQLSGYFKQQTGKSHKDQNMATKGNTKGEIESLLLAAHNYAIRTNSMKAKIDDTQQKRMCRLCGDETIDHIISECNKLAPKECKIRHEWVKNVIHWELCKRFKFNQTIKSYMHRPEFTQENVKRKILWNFEIQIDHRIPAPSKW